MDKFHICTGVLEWSEGTRLHTVDMVVWDKGKIGMGYRTRRRSEYLVVMQKEPIRARETWRDHSIADVWAERAEKRHPHSKPIGLQARLIEAVTEVGDWVLDPAAGGYSVLEACRRTGRNFIGGDIAFGGPE